METVAVVSGETRQHLLRVVQLSFSVARTLELDEALTRQVAQAALLHDVGKVVVARATLHKPGPLTPPEWQAIRLHSTVGAQMLARVGASPELQAAVRHHHERWDGTGYPEGRQGEAIPLASRIVAAVDAFDAMTTARPYRAARGTDEALEELRRVARAQVDPQVAEALEAVVRRRRRLKPVSAPAGEPLEGLPGVDRLLDVLVDMLGYPDGSLRDPVAWVLWVSGPRSIAPLLRGLGRPEEAIRWRCAHLLKTMRPALEAAVPMYVRMLSQPQPDLREEAARALQLFGSAARPAEQALRQALEDAHPGVRAAAHAALSVLGQGGRCA